MWDSKTSRNAGNTVQSRNVGYRQKGCGIQKVNVQHEYEIQRIREHDTEDRNLGHTVRIPWNTMEYSGESAEDRNVGYSVWYTRIL